MALAEQVRRGLADRISRPRRLARLTPPEAEGRVVAARRGLMLVPLGLAAVTGVPAPTAARPRESALPLGLHRELQSVASAQLLRVPPAHVAHRRRQQPVGTQKRRDL